MDDEYVRNGVAGIFIDVEPPAGKRHVKITDHCGKTGWAQFIQELLAERYAEAEKVLPVMDQLNTHATSSLYATFAPAEAKRLSDRLEIHHTPKHGSRLNISEIELSVLKRQCFPRRMDNKAEPEQAVAAWNTARNNRQTPVDWQFKTAGARIKLKKLYPNI
ncbi:MAG: transposase [Kiritimatiellales bacterium]